MRRSRQTWLSLSGLSLGLALSACPTTSISATTCKELCESAYICGVIPSALASDLVGDGAESIIDSCRARCESSTPTADDSSGPTTNDSSDSSDSTADEITKIIDCLTRYVQPDNNPYACTPTCDLVIECMQSATATGDIGIEVLGTSQLTITMLPANFWLSTKENTSWCPVQFGGAPALAEIYQDTQLPSEVLSALDLLRSSYTDLETGLTEALDNADRLIVLDKFEALRFNNEILLPGSLIPRLRGELEAGGWEASGLVNGPGPGGCIKDQLYWSKKSIFQNELLDSLEAVTNRLIAEVSGEQSLTIFSNGFDICQRNKGYNNERGSSLCEYPLSNDSTVCKSFVMPLCRENECNGGIRGCDPLLCFYQQTPPSRACSELGVEQVFLGYEREGTRYVSQEPLDCDNTVSTVLEDASVGDATPLAIVRGSLGIDVPGQETLLCGSTAAPTAPTSMEKLGVPPAPSSTQRKAEDNSDLDPFDDVLPGEYCWVIYGEPTKIIAGSGNLVVPSPFVDYLKGVTDPGVRLGLMPSQLPVGCGCVLNPANCENRENGNCDDGIDNDGDGATDYYAPECLKPLPQSGESTDFGFPFPGEPNFETPSLIRACAPED